MNYNQTIIAICLSFLCALIVSIFLVATQNYHGRMSFDSQVGVQKFHTAPTPRIGGIAVLAGLLLSWLALQNSSKEMLGWIVVAGAPVVVFGLAEDISKNISVRIRMLATISAGILFVAISGYSVTYIGVSWIDKFLIIQVFSIGFTALSISAAANAINIIDGFHGLASGTVIIMLVSVVMVALNVGDTEILGVALVLAAATAGFLVVNFPFGKLFLGDAGAYFLGFAVAALTVMLPMRNLDVSPWISPLILCYPLTELFFSIIRKILTTGSHPSQPDHLHLHMVVHRVLKKLRPKRIHPTWQIHAATSLILWSLPTTAMYIISRGDFEKYSAIKSLMFIVTVYIILYYSFLLLDRCIEKSGPN